MPDTKLSLRSTSTHNALFLRLQADSEQEYKALINLFNEEKVSYKSHNLNSDRLLKIIIRGLPHETSTDVIKSAIEEKGFNLKSVVQLSSGPEQNRNVLPLFYVQIHKNKDFINIYHIIELLGVPVKIKKKKKKYHGRNGASQFSQLSGLLPFIRGVHYATWLC